MRMRFVGIPQGQSRLKSDRHQKDWPLRVDSNPSLSMIECRLPVSRPSNAKLQRQESANKVSLSAKTMGPNNGAKQWGQTMGPGLSKSHYLHWDIVMRYGKTWPRNS